MTRLARRGQRAAGDPPKRLGGADGGPGALSTLELLREPEATPTSLTRDSLDASSADRFTVDLDEWGDVSAAPPAEPAAPQTEGRTTPWRLFGRLVLLVVLSLLAFHHSIASLLHGIANGSVVVYVLAVPLYAGLAAAANNRRPGFQTAPVVRLPDVLLGSLTCVAALGAATLLGPGLSGVHGLWRIDLLMLWLFLLGATVLSFGRRQVARSWSVCVVLLLVWPFPVRLANAAFSGATGGALLLVAVVLVVVTCGHRSDDPPRWQVLGSVAATAAVVLALADIGSHPQRLAWPSVAAALVAVVWWVGRLQPEPGGFVAEHRVRGTAVLLVGLAVVGLVALPRAPRAAPLSAPTGIRALSVGALEVPGFTRTATSESAAQQRYFGFSSTWQRVHLTQGDPATGPAPDGRDIVVDVISTPRPQAFELYPVVTTYPMGTLSSTPDAEVDLGHGVVGQVFRAEDSRHGIAYTLLTFSWRLPVDMSITGRYTGPPAQLTQRITLIAVDNHDDGAPFPEPGNATLDGIRAVFAPAWSNADTPASPVLRADERLLDDTARALVHQRLTGG